MTGGAQSSRSRTGHRPDHFLALCLTKKGLGRGYSEPCKVGDWKPLGPARAEKTPRLIEIKRETGRKPAPMLAFRPF